jgi:hypothetical protein
MLLLLATVLAAAVDPEVTAVGMVATVTMVTAMDTTGTAAMTVVTGTTATVETAMAVATSTSRCEAT